MSAKSLKNLLKSPPGEPLDRVIRRARDMGELTQILRNALEPTLADSLVSANLRDTGELVLVCRSSAWAARLRFEADTLLAAARAGGRAADSLRVSVARDLPGKDAPQA